MRSASPAERFREVAGSSRHAVVTGDERAARIRHAEIVWAHTTLSIQPTFQARDEETEWAFRGGSEVREESQPAMLTGHIDESGNSRVFTLSCLVGDGSMWLWIELAWTKLLEDTNVTLRARGRPEISRYHAADCRNLRRQFTGWSADEQIEFTRKILRIFQRHPLHIYAYSIDLKALVEEIPETERNPRGFAYVFLLTHLMVALGRTLAQRDVARPSCDLHAGPNDDSRLG